MVVIRFLFSHFLFYFLKEVDVFGSRNFLSDIVNQAHSGVNAQCPPQRQGQFPCAAGEGPPNVSPFLLLLPVSCSWECVTKLESHFALAFFSLLLPRVGAHHGELSRYYHGAKRSSSFGVGFASLLQAFCARVRLPPISRLRPNSSNEQHASECEFSAYR